MQCVEVCASGSFSPSGLRPCQLCPSGLVQALQVSIFFFLSLYLSLSHTPTISLSLSLSFSLSFPLSLSLALFICPSLSLSPPFPAQPGYVGRDGTCWSYTLALHGFWDSSALPHSGLPTFLKLTCWVCEANPEPSEWGKNGSLFIFWELQVLYPFL